MNSLPNQEPVERWEKVWERVYDNPINKDGTEKPNKLLGKYQIIDGAMDDYSYKVFAVGEDGSYYQITGIEVSGYYHPNEGGTRNVVEKLEWLNSLLSHQKALSRAEVLEEIRGKIEGMKVRGEFADEAGMTGYSFHEAELVNKRLSDTLAVVDEIKSKEGV